jgi:hypothetical protein
MQQSIIVVNCFDEIFVFFQSSFIRCEQGCDVLTTLHSDHRYRAVTDGMGLNGASLEGSWSLTQCLASARDELSRERSPSELDLTAGLLRDDS